MLQITSNYKVKYFNDGENVIEVKKTVYRVDKATNPDELVKSAEKSLGESFKSLGDLIRDPKEKLNYIILKKNQYLTKSLIN